MCTAAILAGGEGRRLGGALKPLLSVGGQRIIDRQLLALRPVMARVAIVTAAPDRFAGLGVPVWVDTPPGCGPLGGILTALDHATTSDVVIIAGDMPFVTSTFLRHLATLEADVDLTIPRTAAGYQPLCARYRATCRSAVLRQLADGHLAVTDVVQAVSSVRELTGADLAPFDPHGTLFFNVNTPDDYARAQTLAATVSAEPPPR